ncbi:MAG: aminopyrrolnitrin oxygenase, partial [Verrucomicrobiota bacterium]
MDSTVLLSPIDSERAPRGFPDAPFCWYYLGRGSDLDRNPVGIEIGGRAFAGYRTENGRAVVLAGRCSHLGANLARGTVSGERLVCPLHGWEYGPEGLCERIPATDKIPAFARQCSYPVEERAGHVFFFNRPRAPFALPFFEGQEPDRLLPAKAFEIIGEVPWYFIGANGFDTQHFRMAHDRALVGEPQVSTPSPFARRISATYQVSGNSWRDRLTRTFAGSRVTMTVTDWCGSLIFVTATFKRTTTYGLLSALPLDAHRTAGRVIIWVPRSTGILGRKLIDP